MIDFVGEYAKLYAHALRLTRGHEADARDLVHDTIVRALERADVVERPRGYLHVMLARLFVDRGRVRARHRALVDELASWGLQWAKNLEKEERGRRAVASARANGNARPSTFDHAAYARAIRARIYADPAAHEAYRARNAAYAKRYRDRQRGAP